MGFLIFPLCIITTFQEKNELWITAPERCFLCQQQQQKYIFSIALLIVFKDTASMKWQLGISVCALNFLSASPMLA